MGTVSAHVTDRDTQPKATRIVWGTTASFLVVSIVVVSVLVRWRFRRNYHLVPGEALVEESRGNYSTDSLAATFASEPQRLSNAFSEIPDYSDYTGREYNSSMSWRSKSASSYSTRIMSGAWKTSLRPAVLSKPIYHALERPKTEATLVRNRSFGSDSRMEVVSQEAELIDPLSVPLSRPGKLFRQTSALTNLRPHFPSSSLLKASNQNDLDRPSPQTSAAAEEVAFYSAAKQQVLDHDHVITRVLPLRPLPLPPHPRPLPKPPLNKSLG